jgi:hypothetical protein
MPAVSQQQQKLFGLALAVKRGEVSRSEASDEVLNIVDSMSEKDIKDFAETSHSGLPTKVEARLRETLRELMREMVIEEAELPNAPIPSGIKTKLMQAIDKIKDTNLNYNQKLQVIGKVVDSLGIDKKELSKMSSKLKTTLESINEEDPCWKGYQQIGMKKKNGKEVPNCVPESVNEGKKVFRVNPQIGKAKYSISSHDGVKKHKDGSDFFDIETFKNKVDLEKAIKKYTSQGFQMESVNEIQYKDAVAKFNDELIKHPMVKKAAQHYKKTPAEIVKVLQQRLSTKGNRGGDTKEVSIDFKDTDSGITIKHKMKFNESVNEDTKKRFDVDFYKNSITSGTSHEEIIRGDKFSDVVSQATKVAKSKGMDYVEFYYKDAFIGSIAKKNNYTFKKGRYSDKSPLSVNEASYDLGNQEYTSKKLTPTQIFDLAYAYANVSGKGNPMYGNKMEKMIKVANDLAKLTGTKQMDTKSRGSEPALILFLLKNKLVTQDEYIKLYKNLSQKHISVAKALKNADPASRMIGGAAARQAHKDMRGEFEESVNEDFKAVVGKTVFSDGKGKVFFGYYKEDDSAYFVDYKTWANLGMKDVSKGSTNKDKVLAAILRNQKQFNKKVEYNMWHKKNNPTFEQSMDYFMKNGFVGNINKGGIKVE